MAKKGLGGSKEYSLKKSDKQRRNSKIAIAGLSGAALVACQAIAALAAGTPAAIRSITIDSNQQIVIQFAPNPNGSFPAVPHLLDVPGPSHRVVFDFVNAALDRGSLPASEIFSSRITKALPVIKGVRYLNLTSTPKPTARIVIDLPEKLEVKPKVVKLEEDLVVLSLGEGVDLSVKEGSQDAGPRSQGQKAFLEPVADASESAPAEGASAQLKAAPTPGESTAALEAAESASASAPINESAGAMTAPEAIAAGTPAVIEAPAAQAASVEAKPAAGEAENVGTWDWTAGQPAQAAAPAAKTAQADESEITTPSIPVVASNTGRAAALLAETQAAPDSVQAELQKEAGAVPATPVQLKPAMPEPEETRAAARAESPRDSVSQTVEQDVAPQASAPPAPAEAAAASADTPAEAAPNPVQRRAVAPVQKRVSAPVPQDEPIEQQVRTETPDQAPEQEIDGAPSKLSLPQDPQAAKTEAESKAEAKVSYNKAVQAHLAGKLPEAISQYQNALSLNPEFSQAHCNLGLIFNQQHNYAKALSEFRKALAINPKDAITYNGIGAALRAEKDMVGAIKNWQTAVSLDPKLATAHYNLGTAYEIQKDTDRAMESYKQAVKNDYRLGEAYYRMGLIMEKRKLTDEATEQYSRALKVANDAEFSEDARQRLASLTNKKR
ncbi:MAG: tetratricopeptide repeat protein [Candidatus Melainabacteria bacterium]|nr:tetratricopeptide repeat protein [Candidatus Melainabacteria bacterium]